MMSWERTKEILTDVYGFSAIGWILFHLIMVAKYGVFTIGERFSWIIYTEIALLSGLALLFIERLVKDLRK